MPVENSTELFSLWDENRNKIVSAKGGWQIGRGVFNHGYSMMDDLVGEITYFQQIFLNLTGKLPEKRLGDWLEAGFICFSWPDARIWCNHMSALAGSSRAAMVSGVASGIMAADSLMYATGVMVRCHRFIETALVERREGSSVEEIVKRHLSDKNELPGYARPIAKGDERVVAMQRVCHKLGFEVGEHEALSYEISDYLAAEYDECLNYGGYLVAFLADQGFSGIEVERLISTAVSSGLQACYVEARERPAGAFLPMQCSDVIYNGKEDRELS